MLSSLYYKIVNSMAKIYSKKTVVTQNLKPKKEVISFLLSYSQALQVVKINTKSFEIIAN